MRYECTSEFLSVKACVKVAEKAVHCNACINQLSDNLIDPFVYLVEIGVILCLRLGHCKGNALIVRKEEGIGRTSLLERYLEWCDENNNYEQESTLHNLIYTMGGNQSTISYDNHNLWLIDDRLSFHSYIYSDTKIKKQLPSNASDSIKEPDIAIYDIPFAYGEANEVDEISSVVIFELKRPDRVVSYDDFSKQMRNQVKGIRRGHIKNYKGQNITTGESTPIFFYFICDTNAYSEMAEDAGMEGFRETPYKSLTRMTEDNVYQEILTYKTLLSNAKRRNAIFFKKIRYLIRGMVIN